MSPWPRQRFPSPAILAAAHSLRVELPDDSDRDLFHKQMCTLVLCMAESQQFCPAWHLLIAWCPIEAIALCAAVDPVAAPLKQKTENGVQKGALRWQKAKKSLVSTWAQPTRSSP